MGRNITIGMKTLEKNIINLSGQAGKNWLDKLPNILHYLSQMWGVTDIKPVSNMTWNYVAKAIKDKDIPVVIKISCQNDTSKAEAQALTYLKGSIIELIDYNSECNALLLKQAVPGISLRSLYPQQAEQAMLYYTNVVNNLCSNGNQISPPIFPSINKWLISLDKIDASKLPDELLHTAVTLKNNLLNQPKKQYVLHGDLHMDNVISDKDGWIAIDPKGIIGEREFEVACFDFIHKSEFNKTNIPNLFETRAIFLANQLGLELARLKQWVFIRLILGACWMIEDNGSPQLFLEQANKIFPNKHNI